MTLFEPLAEEHRIGVELTDLSLTLLRQPLMQPGKVMREGISVGAFSSSFVPDLNVFLAVPGRLG